MARTRSPYSQLLTVLEQIIPRQRLITDPLRTLAFGTDASFYRLIPKVVIKVEAEAEVAAVLQAADQLGLPVTFRSAGTSLSGQAISDSILVIAGDAWRQYEILDDGSRIRLQPGILGAQANRYLAPYGRKIGPDPASINAAMIGGILANNASGMCCGVAQNSYHTVSNLRLILADGTLLDTADVHSRQRFAHTHSDLLTSLDAMGRRVRDNTSLTERIRHKFKIKNTTGYSLNALVDFEDPLEILVHLMVGSEGTLGFIAGVEYHTVVEHPSKATALMLFNCIEDACEIASALKTTPVAAVELMDRAAMRSVEHKPGMPPILKQLPEEAAALLVETRATDDHTLVDNLNAIAAVLGCTPLPQTEPDNPVGTICRTYCLASSTAAFPIQFTTDTLEISRLWNIRKGLFPSVGAMRRSGTTVIIEDVAFPIQRLSQATLDLQQLFKKNGYHEAIIFGHALEGNLHYVFTQDFEDPAEVARYRDFMQEVCNMVVGRYDGSLKAEHGTGRNMAPFVELEWGREAYGLMQEIKTIFDPKGLLNPGVIINGDAQAHLRNLKPLPAVHPLVDKCIECGFCEKACPSKTLTLTPRHRIVVQREIARLKTSGQDPARLVRLEKGYNYQGEATCAVDGLCALSCPVGINTGDHTKYLRGTKKQAAWIQVVANLVARFFSSVTTGVRFGLVVSQRLHGVLGTDAMQRLSDTMRRLSGSRIPQWTPYLPKAAPLFKPPTVTFSSADKVVYFPSCVTRTMGPAAGDRCAESLPQVTQRLLTLAGFNPVHITDVNSLCCGMPFESKGLARQAEAKAAELDRALLKESNLGRYPILCDTCPCLERMRRTLDPRLNLYEPVEFIQRYLLSRLRVKRVSDTVAVHITCSARKMGLEDMFVSVARELAEHVIVPEQVDCCGFAGDRGFSHPELPQSALKLLKPAVQGICRDGYSNSRTCEIGLTHHSGIYYRSILYLLDECIRN